MVTGSISGTNMASEATHSEVYLDNTTMIGVANLVTNPAAHLSAYTLLDLETFCEAFVLHDRIKSLRQQTLHYLEKLLVSEDLLLMRDLLAEMRAAGIFSTGYAVKRELHDEDPIDEIIEQLNLGLAKLASESEEVAPIPVMVPAYLSRLGAFVGKGEVDADNTYPSAVYETRPTFVYFATSVHTGHPYLASSIRVPLVRKLARIANNRGMSAVQSCLELCERPMRERIEKATATFDGLDARVCLPPLLRLVLEQCKAPTDIIPAIGNLRERADVVRLRQWFRQLNYLIETGNIDRLCKHLESIEGLSQQHQLTPDAVISDVLTTMSIGLAPITTVIKLVKGKADLLWSWVRNRHLLFAKSLASSTTCIAHNRELIESVFGVGLSEEDMNIFATLRAADSPNVR